MAKKKTVYIDPTYYAKYGDLGKSIRQANLEDLARRRNDPYEYIPQDDEIMDYYDPEYYNASDYTKTTTDKQDINDIIDETGDFFKGVVNNIGNGFVDGFKYLDDTANMLVEKAMTGYAERYKYDAAENEYSIGILQDLNEYLSLKKERDQIIREKQTALFNGNSNGIALADQKLQAFDFKHPEYVRLRQGVEDQIRQNTKIQDILYNTASGDIGTDMGIALYSVGNQMLDGVTSDKQRWADLVTNMAKLGGPVGVAESAAQFGIDAIKSGLNGLGIAVGETLGNVYNTVKGLIEGKPQPSYGENSIRQTIAAGGLTDNQLKSLRKYDLDDLNDIQLQSLQDNITNRIQDLSRDADVAQANYKEKLDQIKSGTWYYNPKSISEEYRKRQEQHGRILDWNPLNVIENLYYNIPELGTSYTDLAAFATSVGAQNIGQRLGMSFLKRGNLGAAVATTAVSSLVGLGATIEGRQSETAQEAIGAWTSRLQKNLQHYNLDTPELYQELRDKLGQYNVDTSDMSESEILGSALAFNIKSINPLYNQLARNSHKGLEGLISRNNSLGANDFLQTIPYVGFDGKMIQTYAKDIARNIMPLGSMKYTNKMYFDATQNIAERSVADAVKSNAVKTWLDKRIDKIAKAGGGDIAKQVARRNLYSKLGKKTVRDLGVAASEGVEEGQQLYISTQFENGMYDDESQYTFGPNLSLKNLVDDQRLAFNSVLSYFGLNFGDPLNGDDELRQNMESGAATGLFFPITGNVLSNIRGKDPNSIRQVTKDYRNDKMLIRTLGENYGKQQEDLQVDALFESYKRGMTGDKAADTFETLKRFVNPQRVSNEDLDFAKDVANISYGVYQQSINDKTLDELNITLKSEDHKDFVKLATESIMDLNDVTKKQDAVDRDLTQYVNEIKRAFGNREEMVEHPGLATFDNVLRRRYKNVVARMEAQRFAQQLAETKRKEEYDKRIKKAKKEYEDLLRRQDNGEEISMDQIAEAADKTTEKYTPKEIPDFKVPSYEQMRDTFLNLAFREAQLRTLYNLTKQTENQEDRLKQIKKLSGIGINTINLAQMNTYLRQRRDELAKEYNSMLDDAANLLSLRGSIKSKRSSVEKMFDNYDLYNNQSLKDSFHIQALNEALSQMYMDRVDAFVAKSIDPRRAKYLTRRVKWDELSDEQKSAYESKWRSEHPGEKNVNIQAEWNKDQKNIFDELSKYERQAFVDRNSEDMATEDLMQSLSEINRKSALAVIRSEMAHRNVRKRIISDHEEQQRPLNPDDIDKAVDGDPKSQAKVEQTANESIEDMDVENPKSNAPVSQAAQLGKSTEKLKEKMGMTGSQPENITDEIQPTPDKVKKDEKTIQTSEEDLFNELMSGELASDYIEPEESIIKSAEEIVDRNAKPKQSTEEKLELKDEEQGSLEDDAIDNTGSLDAEMSSDEFLNKLGIPSKTDDRKENPISNQKNSDVSSETAQPKVVTNYLEDLPDNFYEVAGPTVEEYDAFKAKEGEIISDEEYLLQMLNNLNYQEDELAQQEYMDKLQDQNSIKRKRTGTAYLYRPDSPVPMKLVTFDGKPLDFGKNVHIGTGAELNSKLSTPGWFNKERAAQCYYFISYPDKNHIGVHMAIPDGNTVYIVSLPDESTLSNYDNKSQLAISQMRADVINAYSKLHDPNDPKVLKFVKPASITISNGKFNNNGHTYRSLLGKDAGFGLSEDIKELSDQLNHPEENGIQLSNARSIEVGCVITDVHTMEDIPGTIGVPGKMYLTVPQSSRPGYNMKEGGTPSLLTLHERRFSEDNPKEYRANNYLDINRNANNLVEAFDQNGNLRGVPSMGEIVLRLLAYEAGMHNVISSNVLPGTMFKDEFARVLLHMIINCGDYTLLPQDNKKRFPPFIILKQLGVTETTVRGTTVQWLSIGNPGQTVENGVVHRPIDGVHELTGGNTFIANQSYLSDQLLNINLAELFKPENTVLRKRVIAQINNVAHWNTELFSSEKDTSMLDAIKASFLQYLDENMWKPGTSVRLFNNPNLEFNYDDFHDKKGNREVFRETNMLAWMFTTGKLTTNAGTNKTNMYTQPFVFATGINVSDQQAVEEVANEALNNKPTSSKKKQGLIGTDFTSWLNNVSKTEVLDDSSKNLQLNPDIFNASNGWVASKVAVYVSRRDDVKTYNNNVHKRCDEIIPEIIKQFKAEHPNEILDEKPKYSILYDPEIGGGYNSPSGQCTYPCMAIIKSKKTGKYKIHIDSLTSINGNIANLTDGNTIVDRAITGVYSRVRGKGRIDVHKSRAWLQNTLGLSDDQVIVTSALSRALSSRKAYAVTNLAVDAITKEVFGRIVLGEEGGLGEEYHEGWHYVNLLLHNKSSRQKLYDEWKKRHAEDADLSDKVIEEHMAEDFRDYMLRYDDANRSNRILRFFKNMYTFLRTFLTHGKQISSVYNAIRRGEYKAEKLDSESVREFANAYPQGVNLTVPGVDPKDTENFKYIKDFRTYFAVANSLMNLILSRVDIKTIHDVQKITGEYITRVVTDAYESNENDYLEDVLNNPAAFKPAIISAFKQIGLTVVNRKKAKFDKDHEDGKDSGDVSDNIWDIDHLEVSRKDNVSFRAKLFFTTIPRLIKRANNGQITYTTVQDEYTGAMEFVPFAETWNKIMEDLSECDSFDDTDESGDYSPSSIMYNVRRLSKVDPFYYQIYSRLSAVNDNIKSGSESSRNIALETKIQIFNTLVGTKADIDVIDIENPKPIQQDVIEEEAVSLDDLNDLDSTNQGEVTQRDAAKIWSIRDSLYLQSKYRLPKRWSNYFVTSTGAVVDVPNGQTISNQWKNEEARIRTKLFKDIQQNDVVATRITICNLLQHWGIPVDEIVIDNYANTYHNGNVIAAATELYGGPKSTGSISFFEMQIRTLGTGKLMLGRNQNKSIDSIFSGYGNDKNSPINKLCISYARVHPASSEFSVTSPEGSTLYPFTNNNFATDRTRDINNDRNGIVESLLNTSQCAHSLILKAAAINMKSNIVDRSSQIRLKTFVGIKDNTQSEGADYFGITPLEDYVAKMILTFNKRLIDPTMADKKGYYSIASDTLAAMIPKFVINYDGNEENISFSEGVYQIFSGYVADELHSLQDYYNKGNVNALLTNPGKRLVNFHGEISTYDGSNRKYLAFGGNGGMFRYYYNLPEDFAEHIAEVFELDFNQIKDLTTNQLMELLWNIEHDENSVLVNTPANQNDATDGFENIRKFLNEYSNWFGLDGTSTQTTDEHRNNMLKDILKTMVDKEINSLYSSDDVRLIDKDADGNIVNLAIPDQIIAEYFNQFIKEYPDQKDPGVMMNSAIYSAIANHVIMQAISIQEIEKVYSGDSSMYKWSYYKNSSLPESKRKTYDNSVPLKVLDQKDVDKTKRLGGILSPGTNLKSTFSPEEISNAGGMLDDFGTSKYTFMNVGDIKAKSAYLEDLGNAFRREWIYQYYSTTPEKKADLERIYSDYEYAKELYDKLTPEQKATIEKNVEDSLGPYNSITVSDAQVVLRPAMYRKLRISMGEWTFEPDDTGYSDEIAYNLLEKDASWMSDPAKIKIVRKLQLKPLKMSYFGNDVRTDIGNSKLVVPVYNKMAMFPLFKHVATSDTGRKLYERMNRPNQEIDMIGFESAVKVGCNQDMYKPNAKGAVDISSINDDIDLPSNVSVNYKTGQISGTTSERHLNIQVQDFDNLHLQLNTDAHEDTERSLGTQMAKIAMCNVIDDFDYNGRKGSEIKQDIVDVINALSYKGRQNIFKRFFRYNKRTGKYDMPNYDSIKEYLISIAEGNGMSTSVRRILENGGTISSLSSRQLFEQAVSSMVNSEIVDINTDGGSAVQQSVFGFTGLGKESTKTYDSENTEYGQLNNGKEPKWVVYENDGHTIKGHMQVFLSMRFFRNVIPKDMWERGDYNEMRNWLKENNIIGENSNPFGIGYRIPTQGPSSIFAYQVADVLPEMSGDTIIVPKEFTAQTGSDYDKHNVVIKVCELLENLKFI